MSKHGVLGLTKTDAKDHATDGIRINAISPGWIKTDINKMVWEGPMVSWNTYLEISYLHVIERCRCFKSPNGTMGSARRDRLYGELPAE
jgi:NAD(P)-dependent dehydrogenase (short-subunit alcohol dehydrogenase family)